MSKIGFYQCDYPTATACVFSEDNDLLPDRLRNADRAGMMALLSPAPPTRRLE
ncbi:MAG TPA: hypothetical protein VJY33_24085 [Isosphaeraceae bacterium]|nr:hypothetical protein [Isosphaeraceae bacterium]